MLEPRQHPRWGSKSSNPLNPTGCVSTAILRRESRGSFTIVKDHSDGSATSVRTGIGLENGRETDLSIRVGPLGEWRSRRATNRHMTSSTDYVCLPSLSPFKVPDTRPTPFGTREGLLLRRRRTPCNQRITTTGVAVVAFGQVRLSRTVRTFVHVRVCPHPRPEEC